jgi:predicted SAM-dependent methyltransferase
LLDIGSSSLHRPGWIGCDIDPDEESVYLDASKTWPLPAGCARAIRAEHMIEHLTWDEAKTCVQEMFRVLVPGGCCRICTPDLEGIARAYLDREPWLIEAHRRGYAAPTWAHMPNNYFRCWGHRFVFDFDSLRHILEAAGFTEIERTRFNQSRHDVLNGTDIHDMRELEPLVVCVDAVKPV